MTGIKIVGQLKILEISHVTVWKQTHLTDQYKLTFFRDYFCSRI